MKFPAFPGLELLNWEGLLGLKKCSQKMKYLTDLAIMILSVCSCWLFWLIKNGLRDKDVSACNRAN